MIVRRVRTRLSVLFIAMFSIVLAVFSLVFYGAFAVVFQPDIDIAPELTNVQAAEAAYRTAITRIGLSLIAADAVAILMVGVVAWILARRTLEPILEAHRRQQRFLADASHETRNPLTAIKSTTEAALSGERTEEELLAALRSVDATTDRLIRLSGDLLLLARTSSPLLPVARTTSDLSVIVSEAIADVRPDVVNGARLERELQPDLPVEVDPGEVGRAVRNLVDNALRYGGAEPHVHVRTSGADGSVVVEVRDDGPGIAADDLDRIFEPFFRAGDYDRDSRGVGLGLAIARDLAERNGGRLSVTSSMGAGATFRLTLPRLE
jgi:signal transduction histidine kinase